LALVLALPIADVPAGREHLTEKALSNHAWATWIVAKFMVNASDNEPVLALVMAMVNDPAATATTETK
jgi:hypothetical protein